MLQGVGLGLRREFIDRLSTVTPKPIDFIEIAPENWIEVGGLRRSYLDAYLPLYPIVAHGLCLSLGGPAPLDASLLNGLKAFLESCHVMVYSEHLSYCSDTQGHLYHLFPMPFMPEAVSYMASRIREVQERLERRIAVENIAYYLAPIHVLSELEFIKAVLAEADCDLLLDVNNVYVNSQHHGYDPVDFIKGLPTERIAYIHVAGHEKRADGLVIDTHGSEVSHPVWDLLDKTYAYHGVKPTVLERDNNVPDVAVLLEETRHIKAMQYQR